MLIVGVVLLVVAAIAAFTAYGERRKARKATATETMSCGDIAALSQGVAGEVGSGDFTYRCEAVGKAKAGPTGLVDAPESQLDAVWVRSEVIHRYWVMEEHTTDGRTTRSRDEREETVSESESVAAFALVDDSGEVLIHPEGADIDRPEKVVDRFDARSTVERGASGLLSGLLRSGRDSGTLGFQHQEWIIRPGARLYVQGEVADRTGSLVFEKPRDKGDFMISTRSEEEIVAGAERTARWAGIGAVVAAVLGVALIVAGALA